MGMGTVELVMNAEDEFAISIPDDIASEIQTVGQLSDFVISELNRKFSGHIAPVCISASRYRVLREGLKSAFDIPHRKLRPSALISDLIPAGPIRSRWPAFAREQGLSRPRFSFVPGRRFPEPNTTVADVVRSQRHGNYQFRNGEVDTERVWEKVREMVAAQAGIALDKIARETHLIKDLNLD